MLELERYESNLLFNDGYFEKIETAYFYISGVQIPIEIPELAEALNSLSEIHLQVIMQSTVLKIPIEIIAKEFGVSKRMINIYKRDAIEELKRKLLTIMKHISVRQRPNPYIQKKEPVQVIIMMKIWHRNSELLWPNQYLHSDKR